MKLDTMLAHLKGRTTITELLALPNRVLHGLYAICYNKALTEDGQEDLAAEEMMDNLEEGMV